MERINYQVMKPSGKYRYYPDFKSLIDNATCEEEKEYLREVEKEKKRFEELGFDESFKMNMVYVQRQVCGHFEIFQTWLNEYHTLEEDFEIAKEHSKEKCTKCTCNWQSK